MVEVRLSARCHKTEDRNTIVAAMTLLFPNARVEGDDPVVGSSQSVVRFGELLRQYRIRDAARSVMRRGITGNSTHFVLNKQVAAVGRVSFSQESHPLGDIEVVIEDPDIEKVIDSIAPRTRKTEVPSS
jgi:predicted RNA binding protein with dsRBD fold (UPF0201 family)